MDCNEIFNIYSNNNKTKINTMKIKGISLTIIMLIIAAINMYSQEIETEKFKVFGNCGMCEERIENAVNLVDGVESADWSVKTKNIEVKFDGTKVKIEDIHKVIAKVGHDTKLERADHRVYSSLTDCCKYDRPKKSNKKKSHK